MHHLFLKVFTFSFLVILLAGCQPSGVPSGFLDGANITNYNASKHHSKYVYRLGAGDKIRVIVFGEDELSGEFEVSNNGRISLPYVREIQADGIDITTLRDNIEQRYKNENVLKNPKISVEVLAYRPFYIHGEITQAGEYPYKSGMDIRNAVAIAGGYTYRADTDTVYLRREREPSIFKIDLSDGKSVLIYPGDNIQIPERYF